MSSVIAIDFVEHIIQRVSGLPLGWNPEMIRRHSETLVAMCSAHHSFYAMAPSLLAASCVLATLMPLLEATDDNNQRLMPGLNNALLIVEQVTYHTKVYKLWNKMEFFKQFDFIFTGRGWRLHGSNQWLGQYI